MGLREVLDRAAAMPHRKLAGDTPHDARLSSEIGRLYFSGYINQSEYEAGVRYGSLGLLYLESIEAPEPYGGNLAGIEDDQCLHRKLNFAGARQAARAAGKRCVTALDRITIYDEAPRDDLERHALLMGLRALCGM